MGVSSTTVAIASSLIVLIFTIICYYIFFYEEKLHNEKVKSNNVDSSLTTDTKKKDSKKKKIQNIKPNVVKGYNAKAALSHATDLKSHPLFWRELGGHVVAATCVSFSHPKHDLVASASSDGSVRCVRMSELGTPAPCEVYTKFAAPADAMSFTQNAKRLIVASAGSICFFSIAITEKLRKMELVKSFPCRLKDIHTVQVLDVEQWMVIVVAGVSAESDMPAIQAFNPKGQMINEYLQVKRQGRVDKNRQTNPKKALAVSSPDDRFVAMYGCGESHRVLGDGEVGIFDIERDSSGQTKNLNLSFVLAGHSTDVLCMAWNVTGKRLVTCCRDGIWRLWDTSVRYNEIEQPRLFSGHQSLPDNLCANHVAILQGDVVVFVCGKSLVYCSHGDGQILQRIDNFVTSSVTYSCPSYDGQYIATVVKDCRRIPIWTCCE